VAGPAPIFFASPAAFRAWLERHHARAAECLVGFWKVGTGRPSLTWPESVDEAICFGWIDGLRRSLGEEGYSIRFTPRRPGSGWSAINRRKAEALIAAGRMRPAGVKAWEARPDGEHAGASYEVRGSDRLPPAMEQRIRANAAAWAWFSARPAGERRTTVHWVTSAKREATRARRLEVLIETAARGKHVRPLKLLDPKKARPRSKPAARKAPARRTSGR
jgi:uncharacterized protein YdeI (YjbR/CyaY-like superfamily)